MKSISLSINPTYFCNFRCNFCYLGSKLAERTTLSTDQLFNCLNEITKEFSIEHIDIYGGEVGLLPPEYLYSMYNTIRTFYTGKINVVTNLSVINPFFLEPYVDLSVSFDFDCREKHELVLSNILKVDKPIYLLLLASECMLKKDVNEMITMINALSNVVSVEIKPYSTNLYNQHQVTFSQFENFIISWLTSAVSKRFSFTNEQNIKRSLLKQYSSFSDNHLYITPTGKLAVLEFDLNDNEFFLEVDNINQYINWSKQEITRVTQNNFCNKCEFLGHCLSEHLRDVKDITFSCNGFKNLLDWYKHERMEN